jgi:hypothetical protein
MIASLRNVTEFPHPEAKLCVPDPGLSARKPGCAAKNRDIPAAAPIEQRDQAWPTEVRITENPVTLPSQEPQQSPFSKPL